MKKSKGLMTVLLFAGIFYIATAPTKAAAVINDAQVVCIQIVNAFTTFGAGIS